MEVEELEQNNLISLRVERRRGTFGRLTVHWAANGSLPDIFPTSGVVSQPIGELLSQTKPTFPKYEFTNLVKAALCTFSINANYSIKKM